MTHIILTGHAHFASGLASALEMVAGDLEAFSVIEFTQEEAHSYPDKLARAIQEGKSSEGGVLVFCDLKGGTPFNYSMLSAAQDENIEVIGGVNLPVLIETVMMRGADVASSAADLAEIAIHAATMAITRDNKKTLEGSQNNGAPSQKDTCGANNQNFLPDEEVDGI